MWGIPCGSHVHGLTIQARQDLVKAEKALEELRWVEPATGSPWKMVQSNPEAFDPAFQTTFPCGILRCSQSASFGIREMMCSQRKPPRTTNVRGLSVVIVIVRMGQDLLRPSQLFWHQSVVLWHWRSCITSWWHPWNLLFGKMISQYFSCSALSNLPFRSLSGFPGPPRFLWNFWRLQGQLAMEVWSRALLRMGKGQKDVRRLSWRLRFLDSWRSFERSPTWIFFCSSFGSSH